MAHQHPDVLGGHAGEQQLDRGGVPEPVPAEVVHAGSLGELGEPLAPVARHPVGPGPASPNEVAFPSPPFLLFSGRSG